MNCPAGAAASHEPVKDAGATAVPDIPGYVFVKVLGQGGFGVVFQGVRLADHDLVAIKVGLSGMQPVTIARFQREIDALRAIGPPAVPAIYASGTLPDGRPYAVMELIALPNLAEVMERASGPIGVQTFLPAALAMLDALGAVHHAGLIHRDIKPENIFVGGTPVTSRLIDLGLVRAENPSPQSAALTAVEEIMGTAEYMSPEQSDSSRLVDARTDLYAIAVVFYEMLAGRPPFFGNHAEVLSAHRLKRPPRPSTFVTVPQTLEQILLRCLAKDPEQRFQDVRSLELALRAVNASTESLAPLEAPPLPQGPSPAPARSNSRSSATSRPMPVLFFRGSDMVRIGRAVTGAGGELAHFSAGMGAAVFDPSGFEKPGHRALEAARGLLAQGLVTHVLVDLVPVLSQARPDGRKRMMSTAFARPDRYPLEGDPTTLLIHERAAAGLTAALLQPVAGRGGLFEAPGTDDLTIDSRTRSAAQLYTVGREVELETLSRSMARAFEERAPTICTVLSPQGHGRTHLGRVMATRALARTPKTTLIEITARQPIDGGTAPTARPLLARLLEFPPHPSEAETKARVLARLGSKVGEELWPAIALMFRWMTIDSPEVASLRTAPGLLASLNTRAVGHAIRAAARSGPLCLVVDDAHAADLAALSGIELATIAEAALPIWVLVLARPEFAASHPEWGAQAQEHVRLDLGPLPRASAKALCRSLLEPLDDVPDKVLERLYERTLGIPFQIVELIRGIRKENIVRQTATGRWLLAADELDRLPELPLIEWLAERELGALPKALLSHAMLTAVLGLEFSAEENAGVIAELDRTTGASAFELDPNTALNQLTSAGVLLRHRSRLYTFRSALMREVLVRKTPPDVQRTIHESATRYYRAIAGLEPDGDPALRLAHHAANCGLKEEAASIYLRLALRRSAVHDHIEGEALFGLALQLLPEEDGRSRLVAARGRGVMRCRLARYEDALADMALAAALAEKAGDSEAKIDVLLEESTILDWIGDYRGSLRRAEEAQRLLEQSPSPVHRARALLGVGRALWRFNRYDHAREPLSAARDAARPLGDAAYETLAISMMCLGHLLPLVNAPDEAETTLEELIALCESHGDALYLASAINNRRSLWITRGEVTKAVEDQGRLIDVAREEGNTVLRFLGEFNQGELYYLAGMLQEASAPIERAVAIQARSPHTFPRPVGLILRARRLAYLGDKEGLAATLGEVRSRLAEAPENAALLPNEEVLRDMSELMLRDEYPAETWDALLARSHSDSAEQEEVEISEMRAVQALRVGTIEDCERALGYARTVARSIPNIMGSRLAALDARLLARKGDATK